VIRISAQNQEPFGDVIRVLLGELLGKVHNRVDRVGVTWSVKINGTQLQPVVFLSDEFTHCAPLLAAGHNLLAVIWRTSRNQINEIKNATFTRNLRGL
jgi:hypothetical protein